MTSSGARILSLNDTLLILGTSYTLNCLRSIWQSICLELCLNRSLSCNGTSNRRPLSSIVAFGIHVSGNLKTLGRKAEDIFSIIFEASMAEWLGLWHWCERSPVQSSVEPKNVCFQCCSLHYCIWLVSACGVGAVNDKDLTVISVQGSAWLFVVCTPHPGHHRRTVLWTEWSTSQVK